MIGISWGYEGASQARHLIKQMEGVEQCGTIQPNLWNTCPITIQPNLPTWLCDETKILTDTETETFYPILIFPIPIPRLFYRDLIFRDRYRDFFSETKFSETDTETFFPRPNFPRPIPRLIFRDQIFRDRYRDFISETKFSDTDTETFFPRPNFSIPIPRLPKKLSWVSRQRPRPRLLHMIDKF